MKDLVAPVIRSRQPFFPGLTHSHCPFSWESIFITVWRLYSAHLSKRSLSSPVVRCGRLVLGTVSHVCLLRILCVPIAALHLEHRRSHLQQNLSLSNKSSAPKTTTSVICPCSSSTTRGEFFREVIVLDSQPPPQKKEEKKGWRKWHVGAAKNVA